MDDIAALRAEIERLRDLCEENDIDPDPVEDDARVWAELPSDEVTKEAVFLWKKTNSFMQNLAAQYDDHFAKTEFKIGETMRIRLPVDFTFNSSGEAPDYLAFARDLNNT